MTHDTKPKKSQAFFSLDFVEMIHEQASSDESFQPISWQVLTARQPKKYTNANQRNTKSSPNKTAENTPKRNLC